MPGLFLRACHYDFIQSFAGHLTREGVDRAASAHTPEARAELFEAMAIRDY